MDEEERVPGAFVTTPSPSAVLESSPSSANSDFELPSLSTLALCAAAGSVLGMTGIVLAPLSFVVFKAENEKLSELRIESEVPIESREEGDISVKALEVATGAILPIETIKSGVESKGIDAAGLPKISEPLPVILGEKDDDFTIPGLPVSPIDTSTSTTSEIPIKPIATLYSSLPLSAPISPSRGPSMQAPIEQTTSDYAAKERELDSQGGMKFGKNAAEFGIGPYADESIPFAPIPTSMRSKSEEEAEKERHRDAAILVGAAGATGLAGIGAHELLKNQKSPASETTRSDYTSSGLNVAQTKNPPIVQSSFTPSDQDQSRAAVDSTSPLTSDQSDEPASSSKTPPVQPIPRPTQAFDQDKKRSVLEDSPGEARAYAGAESSAVDSKSKSLESENITRGVENDYQSRESVALAAGAGMAGVGAYDLVNNESTRQGPAKTDDISARNDTSHPMHDTFDDQRAELPKTVSSPIEAGHFEARDSSRSMSTGSGGLDPTTFRQDIDHLSNPKINSTFPVVIDGADRRSNEIPPVKGNESKSGSDWEKETLAAIGVGTGTTALLEKNQVEMKEKERVDLIRHETPQPQRKEISPSTSSIESSSIHHGPNKLHKKVHDQSPSIIRNSSIDSTLVEREGVEKENDSIESLPTSPPTTIFSPHMRIASREDPETGRKKLHKSSHDSESVSPRISTPSSSNNSPTSTKTGSEVWNSSVGKVVDNATVERGTRPSLVTVESDDHRESLVDRNNQSTFVPPTRQRMRSSSITAPASPSSPHSTTLKKERRSSHGSENSNDSSGRRKSGFLKKLFSTHGSRVSGNGSDSGSPIMDDGEKFIERR